MRMIIATVVIAVSGTVFYYLFSSFLLLLLFDIPATLKLGRKNLIDSKPVFKRYSIIMLICVLLTLLISAPTYYLFIKYSFGYSISIFVGAGLALLLVLQKIGSFLFSRRNYFKWLDFYRNENSQHLKTFDMELINVALGGKPGELEELTDRIIDETFQKENPET